MSDLIFPYTLPIGDRLMFRDLTRPLISTIATIYKGWNGNKCSMVICQNVEINNHYLQTGYLYNLCTGLSSIINPKYGKSTIDGSIEPGDAFVLIKRGGWGALSEIKAQVTIYLHTFTSKKHNLTDEHVNSVLCIARDAILNDNIADGNKIAKEVLPMSYPIFTTLIQREASLIKKASK